MRPKNSIQPAFLIKSSRSLFYCYSKLEDIMSSGLRNAFLQTAPRAFLLVCLLFVSPGALLGCGADATVTTGGNQSDQTKEDTKSAPDTTPDTEDPTPDIQEPQDTTPDAEAPDEEDTQGDDDAQTTDTEQSDVEDDAVEDDVTDPLPASACADHTDCQQSGGSCIEPGGFAGCGSCQNFLVACSADTDCATGSGSDTVPSQVCKRVAPEDCSCDTSISICKPACQTSTDCKEGERCNPDGHCTLTPCSTNGGASRACPSNFECLPTFCSTDEPESCEACQRIQCTQDAECADGGVCVNGACHGELGTCELPRP